MDQAVGGTKKTFIDRTVYKTVALTEVLDMNFKKRCKDSTRISAIPAARSRPDYGQCLRVVPWCRDDVLTSLWFGGFEYSGVFTYTGSLWPVFQTFKAELVEGDRTLADRGGEPRGIISQTSSLIPSLKE